MTLTRLDPGSIPGISTMRISRKKRKPSPIIPRFNLNERIQAPELRVIDSDDTNLGVMPKEKALELAREQEVDLVEINPKANPPVAKITDFKHFKYQKEKEVRKQRTKSKVSDLKGVRLSIRIGQHDKDVRKAQAEKFLNRGDKVKIEIILRGRERAKTHIANEVIQDFVVSIKENMSLRYDQEITRQGNKVTAIIAKQ